MRAGPFSVVWAAAVDVGFNFVLAVATVFALALAFPSSAAAAPISRAAQEGVVTQVSGGDTLRYTTRAGAAIEVRLRDIDAPLPCQPGGAEARLALSELVLNKPAMLVATGRDAQGRTLGSVRVEDVDVGQRLVENGQAWSQRGRNDRGPLVKQERMAKALGRGVHGSAGAVMPSVWLRTRGACVEGGARGGARGGAAGGAGGSGGSAGPAAAAPRPALHPPDDSAAFRCDGRTRCTQMRSCAEARYFLAHCPGVQMDGDHNGVPCESQWCARN